MMQAGVRFSVFFRFLLPCVLGVCLAAFSASNAAVADNLASYGQPETHWVDPWQAMPQPEMEAEPEVFSPEPLESSVYPVLSDHSLFPHQQAIETYRHYVAMGGWGYVSAGERLELGVRDPRVAQVRERLMVTGEIGPAYGDPQIYDEQVYDAVRLYQSRNGLEADGIVGRRTIAAMNVRVHTRLKQLEVNLRRLQKRLPPPEGRYVFVNIAGQEVEAVENGVVQFREKVIVGKQDRQTPEITSRVNSITFNPYWYVPKSIAMKDMLPKIRNNPNYLKRQGIRVMQGWDKNIRELDPKRIDWSNPRINEAYYLRQDPGPGNSLGQLKINFPNGDAIFLHDTPTKTLFGRQDRNFSSGCVRVQNVQALVTWLLESDNAEWDAQRIDGAVTSGQYRNVYLVNQVPIYLVYITAWATAEGVINFRDDVYGLDGSVNTSALRN